MFAGLEQSDIQTQGVVIDTLFEFFPAGNP
jgi:hypothetical protein